MKSIMRRAGEGILIGERAVCAVVHSPHDDGIVEESVWSVWMWEEGKSGASAVSKEGLEVIDR